MSFDTGSNTGDHQYRPQTAFIMPPISCQVLCAPGMPLPGIHVRLEYQGSNFEALTSTGGVVEGWHSQNYYQPGIARGEKPACCSLTFSSAWGLVQVEYWLSTESLHFFILYWGLDNHELKYFTRPSVPARATENVTAAQITWDHQRAGPFTYLPPNAFLHSRPPVPPQPMISNECLPQSSLPIVPKDDNPIAEVLIAVPAVSASGECKKVRVVRNLPPASTTQDAPAEEAAQEVTNGKVPIPRLKKVAKPRRRTKPRDHKKSATTFEKVLKFDDGAVPDTVVE